MNRANPIVDFAAKGYESRGKRIFAPKVGEAPSLVAGSSRGILSPAALEELFLYQRTANGAGGTGAAVFQSIKGNSIVWNQLCSDPVPSASDSWGADNGTIAISDGVLTLEVTEKQYWEVAFLRESRTIQAHKYLMMADMKPSTTGIKGWFAITRTGGDYGNLRSAFVLTSANWSRYSFIFDSTASGASLETVVGLNDAPVGSNVQITNIQIIDITALLNGTVPAGYAVADFTKFYNLPNYAPNPGAIKNNCATGMVTDGLNKWDEETVNDGYYDGSGQWVTGNVISDKNGIKVFPSTEYYIGYVGGGASVSIAVTYWDAGGNFISRATNKQNSTFTTPANCVLVHFNCNTNYGTTYKNDICINLSGSRNGQYEPHWSDTTALPITTATGKLNGEGESVVISPNGLAGVGSVFDEAIVEKGMWTKTILRVGNRAYQEGDEDDATLLTDGVTTNYPLVTPEEYILDTPVPVVARVDENGTQTILPQGVDESGVPMTAPFAASIFYPEQMDKVYLTAADFKNFLDAAVSGGAITAYTMEWNAATGSYDFTVNQAAATLAAPASSE